MTLTNALYYPWIDINDESWLKTAILYWNTIYTIVPQSLKDPYQNPVSDICSKEGIIRPLYVSPEMKEIAELSDDVMRYLSSDEAKELIFIDKSKKHFKIHIQKLPFFNGYSLIHPEKMSAEVQYQIRSFFRLTNKNDPWLKLPPSFANYYMTILATKLSENHGYGLLTPSYDSSNLSSLIKTGKHLPNINDNIRYSNEMIKLSHGFLSYLCLSNLKISPSVNIKKIIKFRNTYQDELRHFRLEIGKLIEKINYKLPLEAIKQQIQDCYENEVTLRLNDVKKALKSERINYSTTDLLKISFFSVPAGAAMKSAGLSTPVAILAGMGLSLIVTPIQYNLKKKKILRENPYSYLFLAEKYLR